MHIILADDAVLLRDGLVAIFERHGHTVSTAKDAPELLATVRTAFDKGDGADIVVTDVRMPSSTPMDGLDAALTIRRDFPGLPVLVLSEFVAEAYLPELLGDGSGGVGYLLKSRIGRVAEFLASVELVRSGGTVIDPTVVQQLLPSRESSPLDSLSPREREVLQAMAEGASNAEIAGRLYVSEAAVAKHIGNIFGKFQLTGDEQGHRRVRAVLMYLRDLDR
ncbi:response regulator transcription factor [Leifsonia sp. ZF2019]|uniref:response regulator transcription factor n=1 Tax=Leifsonia sp. ZF2019 TaxID=2781978 RepID=UPI001CBE81D2|nr:response regulator transcription factor [Leifsonia sp. ZF2019]UAJ80064.1 response regulator transcription factor [Leifsonia sp. ZF2019]